MDGGNPWRDARDLDVDVGAAGEQHVAELGAFALARGGQLGERAVDERMDSRSQRFRRDRRLDQDTRPAEDLGGGKLGGAGHKVPYFGGGGRQRRDPRGVDGELRSGASGARDDDAALDLAALQRRRDPLAQRRFERAQLLRQLHGDVERPMIHRAKLDGERQPGQLRGHGRKAGHAEDH